MDKSFIVVFISFLLGLTVQSVAGFGQGMVAIPISLREWDTLLVMQISLVISSISCAYWVTRLRKHILWGMVIPILIGGIVGIIPGTYIPTMFSLDLFKKVLGVFIIIAAIILASGKKIPVKSNFLKFLVGVASGFLSGSCAISGPPIAIFFSAGGVSKNNFRASTQTYFLALNIITLIVFAVRGAVAPSLGTTVLKLSPLLVIGTLVATFITAHVSESAFRKLIYVMIAFSGASLLF